MRFPHAELLGRDSNHASFGSEPKILPLDDRGTSCDGWGRTSVVRVTAGCPAIGRRRNRARVDSTQPSVSPPAWIRTTTGPGLSRMPLPVGLRGVEGAPGRDRTDNRPLTRRPLCRAELQGRVEAVAARGPMRPGDWHRVPVPRSSPAVEGTAAGVRPLRGQTPTSKRPRPDSKGRAWFASPALPSRASRA